jgi:hypothetical protein
MATIDLEELYTRQIKPLPAVDRLRLLAIMARDLAPVAQEHEEETEKLTIDEHLARANYKGGALFKTAEEVDAYIRAERDSWER